MKSILILFAFLLLSVTHVLCQDKYLFIELREKSGCIVFDYSFYIKLDTTYFKEVSNDAVLLSIINNHSKRLYFHENLNALTSISDENYELLISDFEKRKSIYQLNELPANFELRFALVNERLSFETMKFAKPLTSPEFYVENGKILYHRREQSTQSFITGF